MLARMTRAARLSLLALWLLACTSPPAPTDAGADAGEFDAADAPTPLDVGRDTMFDAGPVELPIYATDANGAVAQAFAENLPPALHAGARTVPDPVAAVSAPGEGTTRIAMVVDGSLPAESYRLERASNGFVVRGGDVYGAQVGVARLLEAMSVRFYHPDESFVPAALTAPDASVLDTVVSPEIAERGLLLWTLHPIESFFAFWEPSPEHEREAERIIDWAVKNGVNFVSWPALDNVVGSAAQRDAWLAHTQAITAYAHLRGVRVGIGVQLFGGASLQHALVLVPTGTTDPMASITQRVGLFSSAGFDSVQLSFGEFSGETPDTFLSTLAIGYQVIHAAMPSASVTATIHVGNYPSTHVTYMGHDLLYYFLVQYGPPEVVPWVHSVMYFDLFEPTHDAYGHAEFTEHREYLFSRLAAHQPVSYNPETAYWISVDDSVPQSFPLYVRSRFTDLDRIRARATMEGDAQLASHVIFSSGWEWGYWQNDWASARMSWHLPASERDTWHEMLDPLAHGSELAEIEADLADVQHAAIMDDALCAYLSSTDASFDLGALRGVWSVPPRPSFAAVMAMSAADRATFRSTVVTPLATYLAGVTGIEARVAALSLPADDPWLGEIADAVHATRLRADFAHTLWQAAADLGDGMNVDPAIAHLMAVEAELTTLVAHRLAHFHAPNGAELVAERRPSAVLYQYGYLRWANDLCFYRRERTQLTNAAHGTSDTVPACLL
jgi:hypothetical protein